MLQDLTAQGIFDFLFNMIHSFGLKPELIRGEYTNSSLVKTFTVTF
jgi:hypothetical protein